MPITLRTAPILLAAALACTFGTAVAEEKAADPNVLMTVDGVAITRDLYLAFFNERKEAGKLAGNPADQQVQLLGELLNFVLLRLQAERTGIAQRSEVKAGVQLAADQYLANVVINEELKKNPITEPELRGMYEAQFLSKKDPEFKARHILLDNEAAAREVVAALAGGGDFAQLAKERSIDSSKEQGGELGWMHSGEMDPVIEKALKDMQPGQTSEPVKSEFGWHVIRLDARRDPPKPPFEKVKIQLIQAKQRERVGKFLQELKQQAKIQTTAQMSTQAPAPAAKP